IWAHRVAELGAGEILLNSMDADGTRNGFDLPLIAAVREAVEIPVIASGGAGRVADFPPAVAAGADAVLAASVFHFGEISVAEVKAALRAAGYPVRGDRRAAGRPARAGPRDGALGQLRDDVGEVAFHAVAVHLHRRCDLAVLDGQVPREDRELLDRLPAVELGVELLDVPGHHLPDLRG